MTLQKIRRLARLATQLAETLMTVAICVEEIRADVHAEISEPGDQQGSLADTTVRGCQRVGKLPFLNSSILCVEWDGKSVHLGNTIGFRLLARLSRRPNQYVTHLELLQDVWDDEELTTSTIRSAVRDLRRKLRAEGMARLAAGIRGHNGRYVLDV